jgi:hypothetical protein
MRSLSLKTGLLLAFIPAAAAFAAGEDQDDRSYLPPTSLRAAPGTAPVANAAAEQRRRQTRIVHRRREPRYDSSYYDRRYDGPGFFLPF